MRAGVLRSEAREHAESEAGSDHGVGNLTPLKKKLKPAAPWLWLEPDNYKPYPIIVSSTVVPLPIPRTSFVAIASTQPFQDFEWSLALEVGVTLWFVR